MNYIIILIITSILLAGCATTPKPPADSAKTQSTTPQPTTVDNIWMKASLKIAFPDINHSVSATIEMANMDSILINISAMFGIAVGNVFATPAEFIMNNYIENTTYTGQSTRENMMKTAFINLDYNDLVCALICKPPQQLDKYRLNADTNSRHYEDDTFIENIYFDKELLTKVTRTDKMGNELLTINYSKHKKIGQHIFATSIWIVCPQAEGSINIALTDIQTNRKLTTPMRPAIPKSHEIIEY